MRGDGGDLIEQVQFPPVFLLPGLRRLAFLNRASHRRDRQVRLFRGDQRRRCRGIGLP